jgi:hypothetical protein
VKSLLKWSWASLDCSWQQCRPWYGGSAVLGGSVGQAGAAGSVPDEQLELFFAKSGPKSTKTTKIDGIEV